MRRIVALLLSFVAFGCRPDSPAPEREAGETRTAFGAASGVTYADASFGTEFRVVPLNELSGDVEVLFGDPDQPGAPFVMRIRELPGTMIPPHTHPVDEHLTVVGGTFYFGVGDEWDPAAMTEMGPGAYAFVPKGKTMFGHSPHGAVVQVHGVGPFHIHWRDGIATLDEADAAVAFRFRKGERVATARGMGTIRAGYASDTIVQYEIASEAGSLFMADERELRRP